MDFRQYVTLFKSKTPVLFWVKTQFEFNPETFRMFEIVTFELFSFSQYAYLSGCSDVIRVLAEIF